jgi:hypothetical protein
MKYITILSLTYIFCCSCLVSHGQDSTSAQITKSILTTPPPPSNESDVFLGLGLAMTSYRGDLVSDYGSYTPNYEIYLRFNRRKYLNGQITFGIGKLSATNPYYTYVYNSNIAPNTNFTTPYQYLKYELNLNLLRTNRFRLYISQGIGAMHFVPKNSSNQTLLELNNTRAPDESYGNLCFILPSSVGIMYTSKTNYAVGIKVGILNPQTDYLDNISSLSNQSKKDNVLSLQMNVNAPLILPLSKSHNKNLSESKRPLLEL